MVAHVTVPGNQGASLAEIQERLSDGARPTPSLRKLHQNASLPAHSDQTLHAGQPCNSTIPPMDVTSTAGSDTALSARVLVLSPTGSVETMRLYHCRYKLSCSELFFLLYPVVAVQEHLALTLNTICYLLIAIYLICVL